jgi:hypothetical protein
MLLDGQIDAVTFTSPVAVQRFASVVGDEQVADLLGTTVVAAIAGHRRRPKRSASPGDGRRRSSHGASLVDALCQHFSATKE